MLETILTIVLIVLAFQLLFSMVPMDNRVVVVLLLLLMLFLLWGRPLRGRFGAIESQERSLCASASSSARSAPIRSGSLASSSSAAALSADVGTSSSCASTGT